MPPVTDESAYLYVSAGLITLADWIASDESHFSADPALAPALDEQHRRALFRLLEELHCQVFITCVDLEALRESWRMDTPVALFHVEQGRITQTL